VKCKQPIDSGVREVIVSSRTRMRLSGGQTQKFLHPYTQLELENVEENVFLEQLVHWPQLQ
jgi:hypothetical protein